LSSQSPADIQFANVRSKLVSLGSTYAKSERFFPVDYLAVMLEEFACEKGWNICHVHRLLREMGVPTTTLFKIYDMMFKAKVGVGEIREGRTKAGSMAPSKALRTFWD
jgi:nuclear pore complex protein Nup155